MLEHIGCSFCENEAQVDECELFPKYVVFDRVTRESAIVCRDCFELWYRGASEGNRNFRPASQSTVYVGA